MSKRELEGDGDDAGTEQPAVTAVTEESDPAAKRPALEQPPAQDFSKFKIFVGGVERSVDTAQFTAHFAQFGTVVDSVVMKVRVSQLFC
jgi:RNA recognition motif-containing protein